MSIQREARRAGVEKRDTEGGRKLSTLLLFLQGNQEGSIFISLPKPNYLCLQS